MRPAESLTYNKVQKELERISNTLNSFKESYKADKKNFLETYISKIPLENLAFSEGNINDFFKQHEQVLHDIFQEFKPIQNKLKINFELNLKTIEQIIKTHNLPHEYEPLAKDFAIEYLSGTLEEMFEKQGTRDKAFSDVVNQMRPLVKELDVVFGTLKHKFLLDANNSILATKEKLCQRHGEFLNELSALLNSVGVKCQYENFLSQKWGINIELNRIDYLDEDIPVIEKVASKTQEFSVQNLEIQNGSLIFNSNLNDERQYLIPSTFSKQEIDVSIDLNPPKIYEILVEKERSEDNFEEEYLDKTQQKIEGMKSFWLGNKSTIIEVLRDLIKVDPSILKKLEEFQFESQSKKNPLEDNSIFKKPNPTEQHLNSIIYKNKDQDENKDPKPIKKLKTEYMQKPQP